MKINYKIRERLDLSLVDLSIKVRCPSRKEVEEVRKWSRINLQRDFPDALVSHFLGKETCINLNADSSKGKCLNMGTEAIAYRGHKIMEFEDWIKYVNGFK